MTPDPHTAASDPDALDQGLRAVFTIDDSLSHHFAHDGFNEHFMKRLTDRVQARRTRERRALIAIGFLSALAAAALADRAIGSIAGELAGLGDDAILAAGAANLSASPAILVLGLFLIWRLMERLSEHHA